MSRMNAAWSNEPPWAEAVPAIFKEPMTIAFGGAIVAHAIFFLGLPVVAGSEKQPDVQPVATTVLTDQEKSQIPPDLAQTQFPSGSLLPKTNSGLTIPPIPSVTNPPATNFGNLPSGGLTFDQPTYTYNPPATDNSAALAEIAKKEADRKEQIKKIEIAQKQATEKAEDQKRAETPPGPLPTVAVGAMPPGTTSGESAKPAETPASTSQTTPQKVNRPSDADIIAAAPKGTYDFNSKLTGPTIGDQTAVGTIISSWGTRPDSKESEILNNSGQKFPNPEFIDTPTKTLSYPTVVNGQPVAVIPDYAQKVKEKYGTAIVGFAVNGQGKIAVNAQGQFEPEPSIIQSTGYKILDDYAIDYVKKRVFRATGGRAKLYYMVIPIDPPVNKPVS